jgi:hypothetical protein
MRRATTPTHEFELDINTSIISRIKITYSQDNQIVLTKQDDDVDLADNVARVRLTQEETKLFEADKIVEIQIRVLTLGNDAPASDIMRISCERVLDDEVLE